MPDHVLIAHILLSCTLGGIIGYTLSKKYWILSAFIVAAEVIYLYAFYYMALIILVKP